MRLARKRRHLASRPSVAALSWLLLVLAVLAAISVSTSSRLVYSRRDNNNNNNQQEASKQRARRSLTPAGGVLPSQASQAGQNSSSKPAGTFSGQQHEAGSLQAYKCANYCICSMVKTTGPRGQAQSSELIQAKCEDPKFSDLLTLDRRTQIIHISLPPPPPQQQPELAAAAPPTVALSQQDAFRMPRLVQFSALREILVMNLKFEICDSEVFKRGQKLRRLRLNQNRLAQISKSCFKHLDRLIELNLDHNQLDELESALFSSLIKLKTLSIAHNRLSGLAAHQFANLSQLVSLNLVGNNFKTINLHLFEPMSDSLRLLLLSRNRIKTFNYMPSVGLSQQQSLQAASSNSTSRQLIGSPLATSGGGGVIGVLFRNLIKLNVDHNQFERIKLLQLHRFFNVKFLSIRSNQIGMIRDKAFNGLKLVELNLAHNNLQTISKCAFCNSTIRRLVLAHNQVSLAAANSNNQTPSLVVSVDPPQQQQAPSDLAAAAVRAQRDAGHLADLQAAPLGQQQTAPNKSRMLILSQSIFGPLYSQLEYLDLSDNALLASDQLETLIEPLIQLEFLNLASSGLERSLPSPVMFKNQLKLRYLNLSHNQLDQVAAETIETLGQLEVLDLSDNKFNELDESFLVTIEDLAALKLVSFASNPWHCSQCKIAPLYDWILRSPLYNSSCIAPKAALSAVSTSAQSGEDVTDEAPSERRRGRQAADYHLATSGVGSRPANINNNLQQQYDLLAGDDKTIRLEAASIDFDQISLEQGLDFDAASAYLAGDAEADSASSTKTAAVLLALAREFATPEDDASVEATMALPGQLVVTSEYPFDPSDYCLRCEFPGELRAYDIHELSSGDFRFCPGSVPSRFTSEPKIGLTLAIVIIGALFLVIIIVIVVYRKKSNTYYPNEDTDRLDEQAGAGGATDGATGVKKPIFSVSSSVERGYDATDYSSPPISHSLESYSSAAQDENDDDDDEEQDDDEEDAADEDDDDQEDDEEDDDELDDEDAEFIDEDDDANGDHSADRPRTGERNAVEEQQQQHLPADKSDQAQLGSSPAPPPPPPAVEHETEPAPAQTKQQPLTGATGALPSRQSSLSSCQNRVEQPLTSEQPPTIQHRAPRQRDELGGSWLHQDLARTSSGRSLASHNQQARTPLVSQASKPNLEAEARQWHQQASQGGAGGAHMTPASRPESRRLHSQSSRVASASPANRAAASEISLLRQTASSQAGQSSVATTTAEPPALANTAASSNGARYSAARRRAPLQAAQSDESQMLAPTPSSGGRLLVSSASMGRQAERAASGLDGRAEIGAARRRPHQHEPAALQDDTGSLVTRGHSTQTRLVDAATAMTPPAGSRQDTELVLRPHHLQQELRPSGWPQGVAERKSGASQTSARLASQSDIIDTKEDDFRSNRRDKEQQQQPKALWGGQVEGRGQQSAAPSDQVGTLMNNQSQAYLARANFIAASQKSSSGSGWMARQAPIGMTDNQVEYSDSTNADSLVLDNIGDYLCPAEQANNNNLNKLNAGNSDNNNKTIRQFDYQDGNEDDELELVSSGEFNERLLAPSTPALEATHSADEDENQLNGQTRRNKACRLLEATQGQQARLRNPNSNHPALTQTGSQELGP